MRKKSNIQTTTYLMWAVLLAAILGSVSIPRFDGIEIGSAAGYKVMLNDLIYFLSRDMILLIWAHIGWLFSRKIIAGILVRLAIGKIIDEFIHPYGYWYGELIWNIVVFIWAIHRWVQINRKWE